MRIGIFTDYYVPSLGGVETATYNLQMALIQRGHDVTVVCPAYRKGHEHTMPTHTLPVLPIMVVDGHYPARITRRQKKQLADYQFDIIQTNTEFLVGMAAVKLAKKLNVPLIYTAHVLMHAQIEARKDVPKLSGYASLWGQRALGVKQQRNMPAVLGATKTGQALWRFIVNFAHQADAVISPSQHLADKLSASGIPDITVIPNGTAVQPVTSKPKHRGVRVIWIGRMSYEKRVLEFLEAMRLVFANLPADNDVQLTMVGGGVMLTKAQAFVKEHKLTGKITLTGSLPNHKTLEKLAESDVFCMSSIGFDNQPMVIMEAVQCGAAIVVCDPDLQEGVSKQNGLVVPADPAGYAKDVLSLLQDKTRITAMQAASRAMAPDCTNAKMAERYEAVYQTVLNARATQVAARRR